MYVLNFGMVWLHNSYAKIYIEWVRDATNLFDSTMVYNM